MLLPRPFYVITAVPVDSVYCHQVKNDGKSSEDPTRTDNSGPTEIVSPIENFDPLSEDIHENKQVLRALSETQVENAHEQSLDKELAEASNKTDRDSSNNDDDNNDFAQKTFIIHKSDTNDKQGDDNDIDYVKNVRSLSVVSKEAIDTKQRTASKSETKLSSTIARFFGKVTVLCFNPTPKSVDVYYLCTSIFTTHRPKPTMIWPVEP